MKQLDSRRRPLLPDGRRTAISQWLRSGRVLASAAAIIAIFLTGALWATATNPSAGATAAEAVPLAAACNRTSLTWPAGTALSTVAAAISRADGLSAIWQYDRASKQFAPTYPAQGGEPQTTVDNETVIICMTVESVLTRPVGAGALDPLSASAPFSPLAATPTNESANEAEPPATEAPAVEAVVTRPTRVPGYTERPEWFITLDPEAGLPTPEQCGEWVRRSNWEPKPSNAPYNRTTGGPIEGINGASALGLDLYTARVDGNFTGTTDEILQWGACKWGIDEDVVRALAFVESTWNQRGVGDNGQTYGIMQIKASVHLGTYPMSADSTAFAVDYMLAWWRVCYEGLLGDWIHEVEGNGRVYEGGDGWGCVGMWYAGRWWSARATWYVGLVTNWLDRRPWLDPRNF